MLVVRGGADHIFGLVLESIFLILKVTTKRLKITSTFLNYGSAFGVGNPAPNFKLDRIGSALTYIGYK